MEAGGWVSQLCFWHFLSTYLHNSGWGTPWHYLPHVLLLQRFLLASVTQLFIGNILWQGKEGGSIVKVAPGRCQSECVRWKMEWSCLSSLLQASIWWQKWRSRTGKRQAAECRSSTGELPKIHLYMTCFILNLKFHHDENNDMQYIETRKSMQDHVKGISFAN